MHTDEDDESFWMAAVQGVKKQPAVKAVMVDKSDCQVKVNQHRQYAVRQEFGTYSKDIDDTNIGGIDKSTLKKFKREEFSIEAVLDLHGLTEEDAFIKVDEFIPQCYNQGKRCIVIVTGKGEHNGSFDDVFSSRGVLKKQVPQWLNMPRLRGMILAFKHPSERLGGAGALYILLRRKRGA